MMELIDILIEVTTLASVAYLGVMFVAGLGRRPRQVDATAVVEPAAELPRIVTDCVVPFVRPVRPTVAMPTDRELIELAKSTGFPGSAKWSYSRKLSQTVRAILLETWEAIESHKAA